MQIYSPQEDSISFKTFLEQYLTNNQNATTKTQLLDMGTGSGILAKTALKFLPAKNITTVDINPEAAKALQKEPFKVIKSDLFQNIKDKFDIIVFNAPYLPQDPREPIDSQLATTGGKNGDEISLEFLRQAKSHLTPTGKIFLLISSLTPQNKIKKFWPYKIVARKKIFMEELLILEFKK